MISTVLREVHRAALAVGQPAVVEHLQQDVEHVRVRLLDLVEQHHRVRAAAHRLGELAGLLVADVAGRRADQPADRVPLLELAHVQPDHPVLVAEQRLGQRPGQLGLADAGRAEEQEAADRPVRVGQPGPRAAHRLGDRARPPRPGRPPARAGAPPGAAAGRVSSSVSWLTGMPVGPGDHLGDVLGADLGHLRPSAAVAAAACAIRCLQLGDPVAQLRRPARTARRRPPGPCPGCSSLELAAPAPARRCAGVRVRSRTRAPAWSIRSIALSGRNRSVT